MGLVLADGNPTAFMGLNCANKLTSSPSIFSSKCNHICQNPGLSGSLMHTKAELLLSKGSKELKTLRQLIDCSGKKNLPLKLLSHFSFYSSHTKHYHLYWKQWLSKLFLPWFIVETKNTLYIMIQVIFIHSLVPSVRSTDYLLYAKYYSKQNTVVHRKEGGEEEKEKPSPSEFLPAVGTCDKQNK